MLRPAWCAPEECVVSGALLLALRVSQLAGVAPLRFKRTATGCTASVWPALCAFDFVRASLSLLGAAAVIYYDIETVSEKNFFGRFGGLIIISYVTVMCSATLYLGALLAFFGAKARVQQIIKSLLQIEKIKAALVCNQRAVSFERKKCAMFILLLIYLLSNSVWQYWILFKGVRYSYSYNMHNVLAYFIVHETLVLTFLCMMQFVLSTLDIYGTLWLLNGQLEEEFTSLKTKSNTSRTLCLRINQYSSMYNTLCCELRMIIKLYESTLILKIISIICFTILVNYLYLSQIFKMDVSCFFLMLLIWLLVIIETLHIINQENNRTKRVVGRLMLQSNEERTATELMKFSRNILLNIAETSSLGFNKISRTSVVEMMGLTATLLMILLQIDSQLGL